MEFLEQIKDGLYAQTMFGFFALVSGIAYVVLASRADHRCWYFGIISCGLIAFEDFTRYALVSDGILQIVYAIMGFVGIYQWKSNTIKHGSVILDMENVHHTVSIVSSVIFGLALGYVVSTYTSANLPYFDAITTTFALVATVLLIFKFRQNWLYWIAINAAYLYVYGKSGAWFFVLLTIIYLLVSFQGWRTWNRLDEIKS